MPTATYNFISSTTVASATTSVTLSSISGYRDYIVVAQYSTSSFGDKQFRWRINGDTGSNYQGAWIIGDPSAGLSGGYDSGTIYGRIGWTKINSARTNLTLLHFIDGDATNKHKVVLVRDNSENSGVATAISRWANTSAINEITLLSDGNFSVGSKFTLYGMAS